MDLPVTPTQRKMLAVLSDGMPHRREELHACLNDELQALSRIQSHLSLLRKVLRMKGEEVICEYKDRSFWYRHVRLLSSPYKE